MRLSWRFAMAAALAAGLAGSFEPASADEPTRLEAKIDAIVDQTDPSLREVVVTRQDGDGRPTFDVIKTPSRAKAEDVVGDVLGAPDVVGVQMNQVVTVAHKKCRKFGKRWSRKKHRCVRLKRDPLSGSQWAIDANHLNVATTDAITAGDKRKVYLAIVDSGIAASHPDLRGRVAGQINFISSSVDDDCGHGTHVAGIAAATEHNGVGVVGLGRERVRLINVKALDGSCSGTEATVAAGIAWAADHADVINLSIEDPNNNSAVAAAVNYAISKGRTVVAAAGNGNPTSCGLLGTCTTYPAAYPGVIGAAAVDINNNVASFSDHGSWVDVAAPGVGILSTCPSDYCYKSGTSMASPYVAALAAMTISHCGYYGSDVATRIQQTASHFPSRDDYSGYGIIRPVQALSCR